MTTNQVQTQTHGTRPISPGLLTIPVLTFGPVPLTPAGVRGGATGEF